MENAECCSRLEWKLKLYYEEVFLRFLRRLIMRWKSVDGEKIKEEVENINPWFLSPTEHYERKHGINWDNQAISTSESHKILDISNQLSELCTSKLSQIKAMPRDREGVEYKNIY